jgi:hypothetical protein
MLIKSDTNGRIVIVCCTMLNKYQKFLKNGSKKKTNKKTMFDVTGLKVLSNEMFYKIYELINSKLLFL